MSKKIPLKEKLRTGKPVMGTWNTLASPLVTEVMAMAGYDFQIIDLEHGPFVLDNIHAFVSACEGKTECSPLIRIPANQSWMALQAMDQGAHGLVVPHIQDKDSAVKLLSSMKYYPVGNRGFTPFSKSGGFSNVNTRAYIDKVNRESVGVAIIESVTGLNNLDEIAEQDGIDVIYFGAYDLSQDMGHPGDVRNVAVVDAISKAIEIVLKNGKCPGGFVAQSQDDVKWLLDIGMRFITYDVDSSTLFRSISCVTEWFASEVD